MPKGLKKIAQLAEKSAARQAAYQEGGDFQRALVLQKGQTATGRFLEDDDNVTYVYTHELPKKPGQRFGDKILCLDQDDKGLECYGCQLENVGRGTRVVLNFIRYDEPKLKRDKDKKPIKDAMGNYVFETEPDGAGGLKIVTEPMLVVFNAPTGFGGRLAFLESQDGPMTNHVVRIHRTIDDKNPWMIDIIQKNSAPQAFEKEMFAKKLDPLKAITQLGVRSIPAMSMGDMIRAYGGPTASGFATNAAGEQQPVNPENNIYAQAAQNAAGGTLNLGAFGS